MKKIEAAEQQLDTAIRLWFEDVEIVSAHTLACAAYEIVQQLNFRKGGRDLLLDTALIKESGRKDFVRSMVAEYNFFKHADRDPDAEIPFESSKTEPFLLFACLGMDLLGQPANDLRHALVTYLTIQYPEMLSAEAESLFFPGGAADPFNLKILAALAKPQFLDTFLAATEVFTAGSQVQEGHPPET